MASSPDSPRQPAPQEPDSPEAVYRREWRPLYGLIYRAVRRRDDAHDLTQEVFARALPTLDRAPPGLRVRAFLNTIARNLLRDRWRTVGHVGIKSRLKPPQVSRALSLTIRAHTARHARRVCHRILIGDDRLGNSRFCRLRPGRRHGAGALDDQVEVGICAGAAFDRGHAAYHAHRVSRA